MTEMSKKERDSEPGVEAALKVLQDDLVERDRLNALQAEENKLLKEELAAQQRRNAAMEEVNAKLAAAKQAAEERAEARSPDANYTQASGKARHRIILDESHDPKVEGNEVPVGVNGRVYQLKRGVPVDVPIDVINVLNDARVGRPEAVIDPVTQIEAGVRFTDGRRFPFQYVGQVVDDEGNAIPEKK